MDLKQLKTFIRVAETGSLSKASDRLRLAQPALSRHIKLLEDAIGVPLFVRSGRGMLLTDAGQQLLSRVAGLVYQLESSITEVRLSGVKPSGTVAFGMMPTVAYFLAARLMRRVAEEMPEVSLRVVEGYAGHLIDWLQRGEIDATLLYGPASDFHARTTSLAFEELVLVGPATADAGHADYISTKSLAGLDLVLPSRPHGLRAVAEAAARKARVALNVRYEADSFHVLKELVELGLGTTLLPRSAIRREEEAGLLHATRVRHPKIMREIVLALPSSRTDTRATTAVVALFRDEIDRMIASGTWVAVRSGARPPPRAAPRRRI
jgi:DNA-binding transcriptional LysR family regulator